MTMSVTPFGMWAKSAYFKTKYLVIGIPTTRPSSLTCTLIYKKSEKLSKWHTIISCFHIPSIILYTTVHRPSKETKHYLLSILYNENKNGKTNVHNRFTNAHLKLCIFKSYSSNASSTYKRKSFIQHVQL
jgi:hypothetical protein